MAVHKKISKEEAESVALQAFSYLAQDEPRLSRFLNITGLTPETIRAAATSPGFLAAVLDYVAADEPLLLELAETLKAKPERIMEARWTLSPDFHE
jgi:hypothetical protein